MSHPEAIALYQDVLAHPDDDGLRLIYADWLEDNGQGVRAEFIRVQIELYKFEEATHDRVVSHLSLRGAGTPHPNCKCSPCNLRRREKVLWKAKDKHGSFLIAPEEVIGSGIGDYLFSETPFRLDRQMIWRRGFPQTVYCPLQAWMDYGPKIVTIHPIERVEPSDRRPWNNGNHKWGWTNSPQDWPQIPWHLPVPIFNRMQADQPTVVAYGRKWWNSEDRAIQAASDALIGHAKNLPIGNVR